MQFTFHVESLADAVYAKAALEGILSVGVRSQNGTKVEATTGTILNTGALTAGTDPDFKPGEPMPHGPAAEEPEPMFDLKANPEAHTHQPQAADLDTPDFSKDQIKAAAAHCPELATLVAKKGRRSAADQAKIKELTALHLEEKIGEELKGSTAEELQAALAGQPAGGAEVQVPNATPASGLAALNPELAALAAAHTAASPQTTGTQDSGESLVNLPDSELYKRISDFAETAGLPWFRNVAALGGGNLNALPRDFMLKVLADPDAYYPR